MIIRFFLNDEPVEISVPGARRLLDVLREDLGLTGTKEGCGEGECGACTVLIDGLAADSCLVPVSQVAGSRVGTIEGLARDGCLSPLQAAFLETGGTQCGMCTPGMLMAAEALLTTGRDVTEHSIREEIAPRYDGLELRDQRRYGDTVLSFFKLDAKPNS